MISLILSIVLLFDIVNAQFDCNKLTCNPCRDSNVPVDFIFIVDASGSMQTSINKVKDGLQTMSEKITQEDVDPRFWVVLVGGNSQSKAELVVGGDNGISDAALLKREFGKIRAAYAVKGFQTAHGGQEPTFEAMRMAFREAPYNTFHHANVGGTGIIRLRADSRKLVIALTDEDSDRPLFASNYKQWNYGSSSSPTSWRSYTTGAYALELKETIKVLADRGATVYMFVKASQGVSIKQYGDPNCDISDSNFSNFDKKKTLDCLNRKGLGQSLFGGLLQRGKLARLFDIGKITSPGIIENFFTDAIESIAKCELRKRQNTNENCVAYKCKPSIGCYVDFLCNTGCNQCNIGGQCYRAFDQKPVPAGQKPSCEFCIPEKSKTSWSTCSGRPPKGTCQEYSCFADFGFCAVVDTCTVACNKCDIGGSCRAKDWANPENPCETCQPTMNFKDWTDTCPKCSPPCENGGICETGVGATPKCNCDATGFEGDACEKEPVCTPECKNGGVCQVGGTCDCEGTDYEGDDCSKCVRNCEAPVKMCAKECLNGGVCDTEKGECNCEGTGYEGTECQTQSVVPTPVPTPEPIDPSELSELCLAQCKKRCSPSPFFKDCFCNKDTGVLIDVTCLVGVEETPKPSISSECETACTNACDEGYLNCDCDSNTGKMLVECKMPDLPPAPVAAVDSSNSIQLFLSTIAMVLSIIVFMF